MQDRIKKILEYSGLNQNLFADKIAVAPATLSNILKGKTKPSLEIAQNIRQAFPEINTFWLLDGTGEMLLSSDDEHSTPLSSNPSNDISLNLSEDLFSSPIPTSTMTGGARSTLPVNGKPGFPSGLDSQSTQNYRLAENPMNPRELQMVKIVDKPFRKVREIQVFYDDDTYEVFAPKK